MLDYRTHTFLEVYRQRSFTQAAASLMITQPAASQHIKQLESHYRCPLFTKTGRGIEPTLAADVLYRRLLAMENDEERLITEVGSLAAEPTRAHTVPLKFGCTRTIADFTAPKLMAVHLTRHPNSSITMRAGNTRDLVGALDRGDIDFALVEGSFDRERFDYEILSREPYITIAGRAGAKGIVTPGAGGGVAHGAGTKTEVDNPADAERGASPHRVSNPRCPAQLHSRPSWRAPHPARGGIGHARDSRKAPGGARSRRDGLRGSRRAREHPDHQGMREKRRGNNVHVSRGSSRGARPRGVRGYYTCRLLYRTRLLPHLATGQPIRTTVSRPLQSMAQPTVSPHAVGDQKPTRDRLRQVRQAVTTSTLSQASSLAAPLFFSNSEGATPPSRSWQGYGAGRHRIRAGWRPRAPKAAAAPSP